MLIYYLMNFIKFKNLEERGSVTITLQGRRFAGEHLRETLEANSGSIRDARIAMMMATHACARQRQRETRGKNDRARRRRKLEPLSFLRAVQLLQRWGTTTRFSPLCSLLSSSSSFRLLFSLRPSLLSYNLFP